LVDQSASRLTHKHANAIPSIGRFVFGGGTRRVGTQVRTIAFGWLMEAETLRAVILADETLVTRCPRGRLERGGLAQP
jgi:hypothetical protein